MEGCLAPPRCARINSPFLLRLAPCLRYSVCGPFSRFSYGLSVTTLEEVFLRVANGTADVAARKEIAGIAMQRQSSRSTSTVQMMDPSKVSNLDESSQASAIPPMEEACRRPGRYCDYRIEKKSPHQCYSPREVCFPLAIVGSKVGVLIFSIH